MIAITAHTIRQFKAELLKAEASPHTVEKYLRDVRKLQALAGSRITKYEQLLGFKQALRQEGYAVRSINSMLSAVNRFIAFCGHPQWKLRFFKLQRVTFSDGQKELTRGEYHRLVAAARSHGSDRIEMVLQTLCSTGIRISEIKAITVESLKSGMAEIYAKGKIRQILLPHTLRRMLLAYCKRHGIDAGCVFLTRRGNVPDRCNLWKEMKRLCTHARVAKRKVFPHNLRHLFACVFYQKYKDVVRLADILGHSSIDTTRIYTMKNSRNEVQRLDTLGLIV